MLKAKIQAELQQSGRNKQRHKLKLIKYKWRHRRPRSGARPSLSGDPCNRGGVQGAVRSCELAPFIGKFSQQKALIINISLRLRMLLTL